MKRLVFSFLALFVLLSPSFAQQIYTSRYHVLPYDSTVRDMDLSGFPPNSVNSNLTNGEIIKIELAINECIKEYNSKQRTNFKNFSETEIKPFLIDPIEYFRQYIAVIAPSGDKLVWINCFCGHSEDFRTTLVSVFDGGNCYFNLKVNLNRNTYYDLFVNGEA